MKRAIVLGAIALAVGLSSCGGQSLTKPEDLPITTYKKDTSFTLTLVMDSCADTCATYEASSCSVDVQENMIMLDVEVSYDRTSSECSEVCRGQVLAHCEVAALPAGTYTVKSGSFQKTIKVI